MIWTILGALFVATPLPCWALLRRTRAVGAAVGGALLLWAGVVLALHLEWIPDRAQSEVYLAYAPLAAALIGAGTLLERRLAGPRPAGPGAARVTAGVVSLCGYLCVVMLAAVAYLAIFLHEPFVPSSTEVLPLPDGLTVLSDSGDAGSCEADFCTRVITVGAAGHLPPDEVFRRLKAALITDHGWALGTTGTSARPAGWLLDHRRVTITVTATDQGARVELDGAQSAP
ncbi:hypothetical protein [Kitasatospora nipponensis]|uniref:hypothetical protein n=1 Tax=Kitasatospora nipponensis TaxID=258049 RepID=UPI0031E44358